MTAPFVKWVGGKRALAAEIIELMPKRIDLYVEPFVGGGAVFFALEAQRKVGSDGLKSVTLIDQCEPLMDAYAEVRDRPAELIAELSRLERVYHQSNAQKDLYISWRGCFNRRTSTSGSVASPTERAALFIALNRTCFNGLWRVNQLGEMNVPSGAGKMANEPMICDAERIELCSLALKNVDMAARDALSMVVQHGPPTSSCWAWVMTGHTVVYFDPPYVPTSATSNFAAYSGSFGAEHQKRLAALFRALDSRGVVCIASNSNTPLVRELYAGFEIHEIAAKRSVAASGAKRAPVTELLIHGHSRGT